MKKFIDLTIEERENILSYHISTELTVDRKTLNFENIETDLAGTDTSKDFEVPPIIVDNNHLAQILAFSPPDEKGRWIRTMIRTYLEGGRVFYRHFKDDLFIAILKFPNKL